MRACIGIDEVGRGPIAGPTAVAAFYMHASITPPVLKGKPVPLRDSKKLSPLQREAWYQALVKAQTAGRCDFAVTMITASQIDKIGIAVAIRLALARSLGRVAPHTRLQVLLDGGLRAPEEFKKQTTIIKGDEKEQAIAFASIVAKVTRDRYMTRQAKKFPVYGFEKHMGYGTRAHYDAIRKYGMCILHRRSFLKKAV